MNRCRLFLLIFGVWRSEVASWRRRRRQHPGSLLASTAHGEQCLHCKIVCACQVRDAAAAAAVGCAVHLKDTHGRSLSEHHVVPGMPTRRCTHTRTQQDTLQVSFSFFFCGIVFNKKACPMPEQRCDIIRASKDETTRLSMY